MQKKYFKFFEAKTENHIKYYCVFLAFCDKNSLTTFSIHNIKKCNVINQLTTPVGTSWQAQNDVTSLVISMYIKGSSQPSAICYYKQYKPSFTTISCLSKNQRVNQFKIARKAGKIAVCSIKQAKFKCIKFQTRGNNNFTGVGQARFSLIYNYFLQSSASKHLFSFNHCKEPREYQLRILGDTKKICKLYFCHKKPDGMNSPSQILCIQELKLKDFG